MTIDDLITAAEDSAKTVDRYDHDNRDEELPPYLELEYEIGGAEGGDCYGGESEEWSSNAAPPDFEDLDNLLFKIAPSISFLQHKKLMRTLDLETSERRSNDYYGNYTDYRIKRVTLQNILDTLVALKIVETG